MTDENEIGDEWNHIRLREDEELDFFTELALHETERWIQAVTRKKFPYPDDFRRSLSNGVLLLELLNELKPGTVKKINKLPGAIAGLDNVNVFLNVCEKQFGLTRTQLFDPSDLEDLSQRAIADEDEELLKQEVDRRSRNVAITIFWLGKSVTGKFNGPTLDTSAFSALVHSHGNKNIISDDCFKNESWQQTENIINREKSNNLLSPNTHHNRDSSYDSLGSYGPESDQSFDDLDGNMPVRSDMRGEMKRAGSTGSLSRDQPLRLPSNNDSVFDRYDPRYGSSPDISNAHTRTSSTDSADGGFNHSRQSSGSAENYPMRRLSTNTRKPSSTSNDPLQFVKASKADDLAKSALQQIEASKVVNKMRPSVGSSNATEDQDWQSNFDSWKNKRRKSTPSFQKIGEAEGLFKDEEEDSQERKTKTFSQIMAEKTKRKSLGNLNSYPFDDDDSGFGSKSESTVTRKSLGNLNSYPFEDDDSGFGSKSESVITKSTANTAQSQLKKKTSKKADIAPWARNSSDEGDSQSDSETNNSHQSGDTDSVFSDKSIPKVLSDDDSWVKNKTVSQNNSNINRFTSPKLDKPISESKKLWENSVQDTPKRDEKKKVDIPGRSGDRNIKNIKNAFEQKEKEANAVPEITRRPNRLGSDRPWKSMDLTNVPSTFSEKPPSPMSPKSPPALAPRESRVPSSSQNKYGSLPRETTIKPQDSGKDRLSGMTSPGSRYSDSITNPHLSKSSYITSGIPYGSRNPKSPVEHQSKDRFASARSKFEFLSKPEEPKPIIRRQSFKDKQLNESQKVDDSIQPKIKDPLDNVEKTADESQKVNDDVETKKGYLSEHKDKAVTDMNNETNETGDSVREGTENGTTESGNCEIENVTSEVIFDESNSSNNIKQKDIDKDINNDVENSDTMNVDENFGDISEGSDTLTADSGVHLDKIVEHAEETEPKLIDDAPSEAVTTNTTESHKHSVNQQETISETASANDNFESVDICSTTNNEENPCSEFEQGLQKFDDILDLPQKTNHFEENKSPINSDEIETVSEAIVDNKANIYEDFDKLQEDMEGILKNDHMVDPVEAEYAKGHPIPDTVNVNTELDYVLSEDCIAESITNDEPVHSDVIDSDKGFHFAENKDEGFRVSHIKDEGFNWSETKDEIITEDADDNEGQIMYTATTESIDVNEDILEISLEQAERPVRDTNELFTEKTIKISQKPNNMKGFGFTLAGGMEKKQPVTIQRVNLGSAADVCEVEANDELITINGRDVSMLTLAQVQGIVDHSVKRGQIELRVKRYMEDDAYDSVEEEENANQNRMDTQSSDASSLSTDLTSEETYRPAQKPGPIIEDGSMTRLMDQLIREQEKETNNNIAKLNSQLQQNNNRPPSPVIEQIQQPVVNRIIESVPQTEVVIDVKRDDRDEPDSHRPELRRDMSYPAEEMIIEERQTISVSNKLAEKPAEQGEPDSQRPELRRDMSYPAEEMIIEERQTISVSNKLAEKPAEQGYHHSRDMSYPAEEMIIEERQTISVSNKLPEKPAEQGYHHSRDMSYPAEEMIIEERQTISVSNKLPEKPAEQDERDSQRPELRRDMSYSAEDMIIEERQTISVSNKLPEKPAEQDQSPNVIQRTMTPQKQFAEVKTVDSPAPPSPPKADPPQLVRSTDTLVRSTDTLNTSATSDDNSSSSSVGPPAALLRWQRPRTKSEYKSPFQTSEEQIKAAKRLSSTLPWQSDNKISLDDYSKDDSMMNKVAKSFEETMSVSKPVQSTYSAYQFDDDDRQKAWNNKQEEDRKPEAPYNSNIFVSYPKEESLTAQNDGPPSRRVGQVDLPDLTSLNLPAHADEPPLSSQEKFEREQQRLRMEYEEEKRKREKLKQEEEKAKLDTDKFLTSMDANIQKTKQEATMDFVTPSKFSPAHATFSPEPVTFKLPGNSPGQPLVIDSRNQGESSDMKDDSQPEYVFQVGLPKSPQPLRSLNEPTVVNKEELLEQERQKIREEEKRRVEEEQKRWKMEQEREFREQQEKLQAEREKLQQEQERIAREKAMLEQERLQPARSYPSYTSPGGPRASPVSSISPALNPKHHDNKAPPPTAPKPSRGEKARLTRDDLLAMNRSAKPLTKRPEGQELGHSQDSLYGGNMREPPSKGELHSLNAVPKQKVRSSADWMNSEDRPFVIGKRSDLIHKSNNANPQDHWLVQEAERRRKQEQIERRNNYDSVTARAGPTKPSESSLVSRFRGDIEPPPRSNRYSGSGFPSDMGLSSRPSDSNAKYEGSPVSGVTQFNAKTQPHNYSSPSLSNTLPPNFSFNANTSLPSKPPKSPYGENEPVIAVSGKQKCSHCDEELGFGAAMVIETLGLYYHVQCFRCCVCRTPLGNGAEGADVRVRVNKLHCKNCYSNDEAGLKFSKV